LFLILSCDFLRPYPLSNRSCPEDNDAVSLDSVVGLLGSRFSFSPPLHFFLVIPASFPARLVIVPPIRSFSCSNRSATANMQRSFLPSPFGYAFFFHVTGTLLLSACCRRSLFLTPSHFSSLFLFFRADEDFALGIGLSFSRLSTVHSFFLSKHCPRSHTSHPMMGLPWRLSNEPRYQTLRVLLQRRSIR